MGSEVFRPHPGKSTLKRSRKTLLGAFASLRLGRLTTADDCTLTRDQASCEPALKKDTAQVLKLFAGIRATPFLSATFGGFPSTPLPAPHGPWLCVP